VIADSVPWKDELFRVADRLEKKSRQKQWTERTSFLVERDTMTAAYAVRKLLDSFKLSDELKREGVQVRRHDLIGKPVDIWSRYEFWEHYDMESTRTVTLSLSELCNQIIHSWIFMLSASDQEPSYFDGIYVSSDRERKQCVYFVPVGTLVDLFRAVAADDIVELHTKTDAEGVRHIVRASRILDDDALSEIPQELR
jgi:hypothetical protein